LSSEKAFAFFVEKKKQTKEKKKTVLKGKRKQTKTKNVEVGRSLGRLSFPFGKILSKNFFPLSLTQEGTMTPHVREK
jgi:hypothetical protein